MNKYYHYHEEHHTHQHKINKLSRLKFAIFLTGVGMIFEFIGGFLSNSLALLSDAGHMLTHLFALGMSYFAIMLSMRPASKKWTYGFYRAEILTAFINGIVLIGVSFYLMYEAISRFISPEEIKVKEMFLVAIIGLLINGVSLLLLTKVSIHDLNIRSAILHEMGDIISSVGVVGASVAIIYTKNYIIDPIVSLVICVLIIIWAVKLLIDSGCILLESTPRHLDIDAVIDTLKKEIPSVYEVHHVHAWTIASSLYALTAHVVIEDCNISKANELLEKINKLVKERFHIGHTNIQFECLIKK